RGTLGAGDVQWMTAGSGILHQEMPRGDPRGRMHGFQLWANLPSSLKMTRPRYQDVLAGDIPEVVDDDGTGVRGLGGSFWREAGPAIARSCSSPRATRSPFRPATPGSGSCSFRAGRSRSRWPGRGRS